MTLTTSVTPAAMYSLEIRVQRDRNTGATRVLSSSTRLPVDLQTHGVKVYEDEQKGDHSLSQRIRGQRSAGGNNTPLMHCDGRDYCHFLPNWTFCVKTSGLSLLRGSAAL